MFSTMTFNIDFIILNLLLLYTFYKAGNNISHKGNYWHNANCCVALFTFVQGCRFARGNDYFAYSQIFRDGTHEANPFFSSINESLKIFGINEYSCFMVYAFTFILCAMIFMYDYRKYAKYMFPLFLGGFLLFEEYMIRQAFSYSFFFLYLKYLFKIPINQIHNTLHYTKELLYCILFATLVILIHTGNIINIFIVTSIYIFGARPFHPWIAIPIYICCVYILPHIFNFNWLTPILNFAADADKRAAEYVSKSEYWFSAEGKNEIYDKNLIIEIIQVIASSSTMYLGYKLIRHKFPTNRVLITLLNVFIIGICIESIFVNLEILHRIGQVLDMVGYFLIAIILYYKPKKLKPQYHILYFSLIWFVYYYIKYIIFSGKVSMFIWDTPYPFFQFI